jgi:hypothetical protein
MAIIRPSYSPVESRSISDYLRKNSSRGSVPRVVGKNSIGSNALVDFRLHPSIMVLAAKEFAL